MLDSARAVEQTDTEPFQITRHDMNGMGGKFTIQWNLSMYLACGIGDRRAIVRNVP